MLAIALAASNGGEVSACSIGNNACGTGNQQCDTGYYFVGGEQYMGTSTHVMESDADITSYNPSPVWSVSTAWTMIDVHGGANIPSLFAQVGWVHWYGCQSSINWNGGHCSDGNEHIFRQFVNDNLQPSNIDIYSIPSGTVHYEVFQVYDHTSGGSKYYYFGFCWSGCVTTQANITWIPNEIQNLEEVHDQGYGPSNQQWGSQFGGGSSNPVSYSNMMWWDFNGINLTPAMSIVNEGFSGIYATQPIGSSMSVFDGRCSS